MENLVTKVIEKEIKSIAGVKKVTSNSIQSFSNVIVEFNTGIDVAQAKQKVKDAVDKAKNDLPTDLPNDPSVREIEFSEMPILFVNISGDYDLAQLKKYADDLEDRIEALKEITRVDIDKYQFYFQYIQHDNKHQHQHFKFNIIVYYNFKYHDIWSYNFQFNYHIQ